MGCLISSATGNKGEDSVAQSQRENVWCWPLNKSFSESYWWHSWLLAFSIALGFSMINIYPLGDCCDHRQNVLDTAWNTASSWVGSQHVQRYYTDDITINTESKKPACETCRMWELIPILVIQICFYSLSKKLCCPRSTGAVQRTVSFN